MGQVKELSQDPEDKLSAIFWILAKKAHSQDMKEKWKEQHQKCVPCEMRYKYIVHQTDEQNIINTVYGEIAATGTTEGPERTLTDENEELLATVDRSALELVYKRFFGDFVYFGFSSSYVRKILTASKYRKNDEIWAEKLNQKTDSEADYLSCL
ncbi:Oidioi.mRNA.OKI2018_I69.chr2.g6778.t1.cds [Oikopleura dioica]|uniref:Oidioi.mRNA.OKI2018_I69.chr2.g6778.t1.cds n=1 Tax=Oikopleura dioica TaxID=34765 RepID=A0ABN7TB51_OIKDI|nr:Oidioi.mRNA.OKI2018_I69.chr2.g6778.t1.cds [Oikopleura dioica]